MPRVPAARCRWRCWRPSLAVRRSPPVLPRPDASRRTNITAIAMFVGFVLLTLVITYWAARRTRSTADFYAAGGGITGLQNGLAIAGDYMSAASFLGISAWSTPTAMTG